MGGLCFGGQLTLELQGGAEVWFNDVPFGNLNCWVRSGVGGVGSVGKGIGVKIVGIGHCIW